MDAEQGGSQSAARGFVVGAILCAVVAAATPEAWLVGDAEGQLGAQLALGALLWRGAWLALAVFLAFVAPRVQGPSAPDEGGDRRASVRSGRAVLGLVALAALLRLPGLGSGLWFDEIWMLVDFVRPPLSVTLRSYPTDNHHPLYTLLAWLSVHAFGEHAWALRLPAWLFGVGCVAALHHLAAPLVGRRTSLFACALLTVSSHHVAYSQNARGYTVLLFFALVSSAAFLATLRGESRRAWFVQGIALALATAAHLTALFLAAAQALIWIGAFVAGGRRRPGAWAPLWGLVLAGLVSLALHSLILPQMFHFFFLRESRVAIEAQWTQPLWTLVEAVRSLGLSPALGLALALPAAAVGLTGLFGLWRRSPPAAVLCVLPAVLVAAAMLGLGRNLWPRLFFFCAGFFVLVGATGVSHLLAALLRALGLGHDHRRLERIGAAVGAVLVVAVAALLPRVWNLPKQDYEGAQRYVDAQRAPGDVVLTVGLASFPYEAYYGGDYLTVETADELRGAIAGADTAYVVSTFPIYLESRHPDLAELLRERGRELRRFPGSVGDGDVVVLSIP